MRPPTRRGLQGRAVRLIELALGLSAAGATTMGLGIFHPHSTFFGPSIWRGPRDRPQVALTFDDGPHPTFTPRIAQHLDEHRALATFFCVGAAVERNLDVVRALVAAGHEIGNHSYSHNTFGDLFVAARLAADLERNQALLSTCAPAPRFYRPVAGVRNPKVHAAARQVGLSIVTWTNAPRDGVWRLTPEKMRRLAARARPGDIIALHDGTLSEQTDLRESTVRSLPTLLEGLRARGLSCVTLSTLLAETAPAADELAARASSQDRDGAFDRIAARSDG
jgi:peptidoglycan/xylan/chitin deacetylase (PgdA/CDA1 family)